MPSSRESRYKRQLGLVHQRRLDDLAVEVAGVGPALPFLLAILAMLGTGRMNGAIFLRARRGPVGESDLFGPIPFDRHDLGKPFADACADAIPRLNPEIRIVPIDRPASRCDARLVVPGASETVDADGALFAQAGRTSVWVGPRPVAVDAMPPTILSPALNCLAAALLAQQMLVHTRCVRQTTVASAWVTLNLVVRGRAARALRAGGPTGIAFRWRDGTSLLAAPGGIDAAGLDEGDALLRVVLPEHDGLVERIVDTVTACEEPAPGGGDEGILWSACPEGASIESGRLVEHRPFDACELAGRSVFVAGVGALGSWLTMLVGLATSRGCRLTLVDNDAAVERHNLNRQVLYQERDVGRPKVIAAADRLRLLNPALEVRPIRATIDEGMILAARDDRTEPYERFIARPEFEHRPGMSVPLVRDARGVLAGELQRSHAVAACLDNLRSRYHLNVLCEAAKVPLVNAAAQDFDAVVHRIDPRAADPCLVCREGERVREDGRTHRCGEAGDIPIQSLATTSAVAASLQAIVLLASLAGADDGFCNHIAFDGRCGRLVGTLSRPRWPEECPAHLLDGEFSGLRALPRRSHGRF